MNPRLDVSSSPASPQAEQTILGAILLDNNAYDEAERVTYGDFSLSSHRTIFRRMAGMMSEGIPIDYTTLSQTLRDHYELDSIGGIDYLLSLTEGLPRRLSIDAYVRIVKEKARMRSLIAVCESALLSAQDQSIDSDELLADVDTQLMQITAERSVKVDTLMSTSIAEFERLMDEKKAKLDFIGIPTGNLALDQTIGGWVEGELAIIAGKPGQGKSSALIQTLIECGKTNVPAHCFSPEMTKGQILRRIWAAVADLPFTRVRHASSMSEYESRLIRDVMMEVAEWKLIIDDDPNLTAPQIVSMARISKRRNGTRLIGVDYLQKLRFTSKPEHRHIEVSDAAVKFANLAKNEHIAVVALSSLTDKGGRLRNTAPTLGDLRQSGDIQYEASTVVFIHREVNEHNEKINTEGVMIIPKQRNGETGQFPVEYNNRLMFGAATSSVAEPQQYALQHKNDDFA
jgi:replicative DNA helicase